MICFLHGEECEYKSLQKQDYLKKVTEKLKQNKEVAMIEPEELTKEHIQAFGKKWLEDANAPLPLEIPQKNCLYQFFACSYDDDKMFEHNLKVEKKVEHFHYEQMRQRAIKLSSYEPKSFTCRRGWLDLLDTYNSIKKQDHEFILQIKRDLRNFLKDTWGQDPEEGGLANSINGYFPYKENRSHSDNEMPELIIEYRQTL